MTNFNNQIPNKLQNANYKIQYLHVKQQYIVWSIDILVIEYYLIFVHCFLALTKNLIRYPNLWIFNP